MARVVGILSERNPPPVLDGVRRMKKGTIGRRGNTL